MVKTNRKRKEIELPPGTITTLKKLAEKENQMLKPFMEKILMDYAEQNKTGKK